MDKNLLSWTVLNPTHKIFKQILMLNSRTWKHRLGSWPQPYRTKLRMISLVTPKRIQWDCMVVQLRSGKELRKSIIEKTEKTEQEGEEETGRKNRKSISELIAETENKVQNEQPRENCEQK